MVKLKELRYRGEEIALVATEEQAQEFADSVAAKINRGLINPYAVLVPNARGYDIEIKGGIRQ